MLAVNRQWYIVLLLMVSIMALMGYVVDRHESILLFSGFLLLFGSYVWLVHKRNMVTENIHFRAGLLLRVILLLMIPNLSDDIYRFIWDGQLLWNGINPFAEVPAYYMEIKEMPAFLSREVYSHLNSPEYFSIYPPISQFIYMLTAAIAGGNILGSAIIIRILLIGAEIGTYFLLKRYCRILAIDSRRVSWYWLNPLVILELTGNLHFEGFMIFFILLCLLLLESGRILMGAAALALAVGVKLLPLLFLPVIWKRLGFRKFLTFCLGLGISVIVIFIPFLNMEFITGISDSLGLYFQKFEFNASVYYVVREVGYWYKGYNIIASAGPWLAGATLLFIVTYSYFYSLIRTHLTTAMGISLTLFLLLATTVHPWYILLLIPLFLLQGIHYPVLWSGLATLSYIGYNATGYSENLWLTFIEYALVIVYMGYELVYRKKDRTLLYEKITF